MPLRAATALFLTVLILCLLATIAIKVDLAIGQIRTVGVSVGDSFKYTTALNWSSRSPTAPVPSYYASANETEWWSASIIEVSDTNVTTRYTTHFKNGTELVEVGSVDIATGEGNWTSGNIFIIAANLNPNDAICTSGIWSAWRINETMTRGSRSTNHLNITQEIDTIMTKQYLQRNFYWDRQTGVMVESSLFHIAWENVSIITTLIESDVWTVPKFPALTPMQVVIILVIPILLIIFVVLYRRRLSRTRSDS